MQELTNKPRAIDRTAFANVDGTPDPAASVNYLDEVMKFTADRYKRETYELIELTSGDAVLDVGCGTGDDVRAMAEIVGPTGRAVGIDISQALLDEARKRA